MIRIGFGMIALVGFALAATVHAATSLEINVWEACPYVLLVQVGVFVAFIPCMVADVRKKFFPAAEVKCIGRKSPAFLECYPEWTLVVGAVLNFYALAVCLPWYIATSGGGIPRDMEGVYVLAAQYNRVVRVLTKAEFHEQQIYFLHAFSSMWMIQYFCVGAMLLIRRDPPMEPADRPSI